MTAGNWHKPALNSNQEVIMSILYLSARAASHPMSYETWVTGLITIALIGLLLLWLTSLAGSKRGER